MRDRAFRRFQIEKRKDFARNHIWWMKDPPDKWVGIFSQTPHSCSCYMCGHMRKWYGRTEQEIKNDLDTLDEIEEVWYNDENMKKD